MLSCQFLLNLHFFLSYSCLGQVPPKEFLVGINVEVFYRPGVLSVTAFSALTLLVGQQEGHPACKKT